MRIELPAGHTQLSLEGVTYNKDADGTFDVPPQYFEGLKIQHGATAAPSVEDLEDVASRWEAHASALAAQLEQATREAKSARVAANQSKARKRAAISQTVANLQKAAEGSGDSGSGS